MMKTKIEPAPRASNKTSHMAAWGRRVAGQWTVGAILGSLVACGVAPPARPPGSPSPPGPAQSGGTTPAITLPQAPGPAPVDAGRTRIVRARAQWLPAAWADLPGWGNDRALALWPALLQSCARLSAEMVSVWRPVCARALASPPVDDMAARAWLERELQPYQVQSLDGDPRGLATGYFEPSINASRQPRPGFTVPLHRPPADLAQKKPYWTRQQQDTLPAARAALRGREIAYVASPLDALILQIQGSGRLRVTEADASQRLVRLAFAGHNDQPYRSVGAWLIEQGEIKPGGANWPAIRDWAARARPDRVNEMLWSNPRVVYFREEPLPDETLGPRGAQGVPLTAGRSVAVDPQAVPYGSVLWLDTTEPLTATPLRRLVLAQDTGSAITGAVRIDYFWGAGEQAEAQAGRMKQGLRLWALWPAR